ncbi:uncharacterized protein LOC113520754 isoform X3 [Galleria mellonella]|uniref:Uncharacterized protein LOC113520754 isoform X3 n=1 Tax=Galleria mellonella TaxID=7137 RepID=A0A6J3C5L7_GALME|nr:uncharacterized protein LOC113520754 isoform X3 [Galleria mellonella]
MSDQEKKSSGVAATGSIVMVEQTGASRHKQPYRPTELHDGATSDLHHRHSRVPPASSLAEELKVFTIHQDIEEQKECDRATSSEKHKQSETKIISGNTKRRESSPETIALAALEVETKKGPLPFSSQPIPAQAETVISATSNLVLEKIQETSLEKKADDDSITEEVAELRTSDAAENRSVWNIETRSQAWTLEGKASIGPCFQPGMSKEGRSGIMICVPKKSVKNLKKDFSLIPSVINISISKKCLTAKSRCEISNGDGTVSNIEDQHQQRQSKSPHVHFCEVVKAKIDVFTSKIKNVLNI